MSKIIINPLTEHICKVKDLGTYHIKVELMDGRGWIQQWDTGWRYTGGAYAFSPLDAKSIAPTYEDEEELFHCMEYMYTDGNYGCDCNKVSFWAYSQQQEPPDVIPCGDTMTLKRITAIRPDQTEVVIYEAS